MLSVFQSFVYSFLLGAGLSSLKGRYCCLFIWWHVAPKISRSPPFSPSATEQYISSDPSPLFCQMEAAQSKLLATSTISIHLLRSSTQILPTDATCWSSSTSHCPCSHSLLACPIYYFSEHMRTASTYSLSAFYASFCLTLFSGRSHITFISISRQRYDKKKSFLVTCKPLIRIV